MTSSGIINDSNENAIQIGKYWLMFDKFVKLQISILYDHITYIDTNH